VRAISIFALVLLAQAMSAKDKGVSWALIDPFCGEVRSTESAYPIRSATVKLYRAKAKHVPCCDSAERLEDVYIDEKGNFDLRKLPAGQYWLLVVWEKTEVPVALWVEGRQHFACSEEYKNIIEVKPSTRTAERLVVASTDSLAHAQTH